MARDGDRVDAHADTVGSEPEPAPVLGATLTDAASPARRERASEAGEASVLVGRTLAHFRIEELLGRGGMGEVYLATDLALDRPVAVKVLASEIARDQRLRDRFYREARAQARIQHPNVCHIYFIGEQDDLLFFAMEYIDGQSVVEKLEQDGGMDAGEAVEICRMAALGLREAHRHGFTHRDVKPSNLMMDRSGAVKLVDFGLVKKTAEVELPDAPRLPDGAVEKTAIVGTPLYMAPEQARGEGIDLRADVYALGATLHHLVSGAPPFAGDSAKELVSLHLSQPRPRIERKRRRRGPAPVDALCDRMMAKSPDDRFADYDELIAALENVSPARTRPAGFLVRSFAVLIDAMLIGVALMPLEILLPALDSNLTFLIAWMTYLVIGHGRFGRTLGKSALEIELVSADRHEPPGIRAALIRALVQWGPAFFLVGAANTAEALAAPTWLTTSLGIMFVAWLLLLLPLEGALSAWLVPGKRTYWDRSSGTRVRYRRLSSE